MAKSTPVTGEQFITENFESEETYLLHLRHLFAYEFAKDKISESSFVLEVGCGVGYGTKILAEKAEKIVALDIDKKTITRAADKYKIKNCDFRLYDGVKIPYENDTFDTVISFQVIEHVPDDVNFLSEVYRVLKPDGIFILTTPDATYRLKPGQKPWYKYHVREYYSNDFHDILKTTFSDFQILTLCAIDSIYKIETDRVKRILKTKSIIPVAILKRIPEPVKAVIGIIRKKINSLKNIGRKNADFLSKYSIKDFYITEDNISNGLDLLAICKK